MIYLSQLLGFVNAAKFKLSDIKPSEWNEQRRFMTSETSPFPGKFSYSRTPYLREIVDTLHPGHPARIVAIMKGAQVGFSTGVIESGLGYIIDQVPAPTLFLTGHADLTEEAMTGKIDNMIDSCGLRPLIKPNTLRKKSQRTGDTNSRKEFPGGYVIGGHANHKTLRQRSVRYGFFDDFEAMPQSSKASGSTTRMIEQRFAAYADKMKIYYISTPELEETSNIMPVYLNGDQRKFHIPCPCCGEFIALEWEVKRKDSDEMAGMTWKVDDDGRLIDSSVGYICQECGGWFNDSRKYELNLQGEWRPTAVPIHEGYYSYHLSSLYAPPGMYDWLHYVRQYMEAYPAGGEPKDDLVQTFNNLCLGLTYKPLGKDINARALERNCRDYEVGTIPETMSIADGNGSIVLLTCAVDLGGRPEDGRIDWEICAHAETGSTYSIAHGSIGTFVSLENPSDQVDRKHWTYAHDVPVSDDPDAPISVWPELEKIVTSVYQKDTGKKMRIFITTIDTGHPDIQTETWQFINNSNGMNVLGLKGLGESQPMLRQGIDLPLFKNSVRNPKKLFIAHSNIIKDALADLVALKWSKGTDQPHGFMNFPSHPYLYRDSTYFEQFEAEHRVMDESGSVAKFIWKKKNSRVQNHFFDCRCYNMVARDIFVQIFGKELKIQKPTWPDIAKYLKQTFG